VIQTFDLQGFVSLSDPPPLATVKNLLTVFINRNLNPIITTHEAVVIVSVSAVCLCMNVIRQLSKTYVESSCVVCEYMLRVKFCI